MRASNYRLPSGFFSGGELENGTFHGGKIEGGTFHLLTLSPRIPHGDPGGRSNRLFTDGAEAPVSHWDPDAARPRPPQPQPAPQQPASGS